MYCFASFPSGSVLIKQGKPRGREVEGKKQKNNKLKEKLSVAKDQAALFFFF